MEERVECLPKTRMIVLLAIGILAAAHVASLCLLITVSASKMVFLTATTVLVVLLTLASFLVVKWSMQSGRMFRLALLLIVVVGVVADGVALYEADYEADAYGYGRIVDSPNGRFTASAMSRWTENSQRRWYEFDISRKNGPILRHTRSNVPAGEEMVRWESQGTIQWASHNSAVIFSCPGVDLTLKVNPQ